MATRTCEECKLWLYDEHGAKRQKFGEDVKRPDKGPGSFTDCETSKKCAKGNPQKAAEYELSERNQRMLEYYYRVRATGGNCPLDTITRRQLSVIDRILRPHEAQQAVAAVLPLVMGSAIGGN